MRPSRHSVLPAATLPRCHDAPLLCCCSGSPLLRCYATPMQCVRACVRAALMPCRSAVLPRCCAAMLPRYRAAVLPRCPTQCCPPDCPGEFAHLASPCWPAAPLPCCPAVSPAAVLPCWPAAALPRCPAAVLAFSDARRLMFGARSPPVFLAVVDCMAKEINSFVDVGGGLPLFLPASSLLVHLCEYAVAPERLPQWPSTSPAGAYCPGCA